MYNPLPKELNSLCFVKVILIFLYKFRFEDLLSLIQVLTIFFFFLSLQRIKKEL